ncbi:DUF6315 family protein [Microlunatus speluncae]|uniref:DUF6315 family protein n=1 Tax=Microlunatus speluncae TaxID=2594267 RepID=UPI00126681C1|nr:DUF6315 family protein [Microlunatus speluncae]
MMISELQPVPGRFRALCCECGAVRSFNLRYTGGNRIGDSRYADERCTIDLKCAVCGVRRRHAYLLDNFSVPDFAEKWQRPAPPQGGYDPFLEATGRWADWTFVETPLPDGIIEIIDADRREAYFDPAGWEGDSTLGLAHVLAHLDLRHHELFESTTAGDQLELEAERMARERLDRPWRD